jgi:phospholipid/cholesterol/gamma-HCH transport system ATP-binding protein
MPAQLSSGMAKRVALARALALDARIVIVDDFDSGIDGVRLALLCDLIQDIQSDTGATFLVTTHDMTATRKLADHVAVIHEGRIVASGEAAAMFDSTEPLVGQLIAGELSGPIRLGSP